MFRIAIVNLIYLFVVINFRSEDLIVSTASESNAEWQNTWPESPIPYEIDNSLTIVREVIERALDEFKNKTCLSFKSRTDENDYVVFRGSSICQSHNGTIGGRQEIELSLGCANCKNRVVHEIIHTIGFPLALHPNEQPCEPGSLSPENIERIQRAYNCTT